MDQAFKKDLLQAFGEGFAEKTSLKPELVGPRQFTKPDNAPYDCISNYEVEAYIKRYYKRIKLHNHQIFGTPAAPEQQRFLYLLPWDKRGYTFRKAYISVYSASPFHFPHA